MLALRKVAEFSRIVMPNVFRAPIVAKGPSYVKIKMSTQTLTISITFSSEC